MELSEIAKLLPLHKSDWETYFFSVALLVSSRADCTRRQFGCIAVSPDKRIVATGYNSPPPNELSAVQRHFKKEQGTINVTKIETITRLREGLLGCCKAPDAPKDQGYDCCNAVHAEQNAILQLGTVNQFEYVDLYIAGRNGLTGELLDVGRPCILCSRFIKSTNVRDIKCLRADEGIDVLQKKDLVTTA